jgi:ABC-type uncharacterized transport system involved in gliding motility auxiliary subunit
MSMDSDHTSPSFSSSRRWFIGFHVLLAVAAFAAIIAMVNYLSVRHFIRHNVTGNQLDKLTPATLQVLQSLTNNVRVIIYFDPEHPLFPYTKSMLEEYAAANRFVKLETINYRTEPTKALQVLSEYRLPQDSKDMVIFAANGKMDYVAQGELSDLDMNDLIQGKGKEVKRKAFKGEVYFTSKILTVSNAKPSTAYYLIRHGEHEPQAEGAFGYKKFVELLIFNNVKVNALDLIKGTDVPADCDLLIIAGPQEEISTAELEKVDRYLSQGGRLFFLANASTKPGPERLLAKWGVELGNNLVFDAQNTAEGQLILFENYGSHPIVQPLSKNKLVIYQSPSRSVSAYPGSNGQADSAKVTDLFSTGPGGVAYTDFHKGVPYATPNDRRGVIPVAVAAEKGGLRTVKLERGTTRLVVCGDSYLLDNSMMQNPGNEEFARQTFNWLLGRNIMVGSIGPRSFTEYTMVVTDSQMTILRWILLGAIPGGVFGLGLLVYLRRQR